MFSVLKSRLKSLSSPVLSLIPSKKQYKNWSLPSKYTTLAFFLALFMVPFTLIPLFLGDDSEEQRKQIQQTVEQTAKETQDQLKKYFPKEKYLNNYMIDIKNKKIFYQTTVDLLPDIKRDVILDIEYPEIIYPEDTHIQDKVNEFIKEKFNDRLGVNLSAGTDKSNWVGHVRSKYKIKYQIKNLLGITIEAYFYGLGAGTAHNMLIPLNINLANGDYFEFKDIFRSKGIVHVNLLIKERLRRHPSYDMIFDIDNISIRDDQGFFLRDGVIFIVFDKYEIAAGAASVIEVGISIEDLREYINPNGPFSLIM